MYRRPFPRAMAIGVAHRSPGAPAPPAPPFTYDYFVSPTGSPSNPGTFESPWNEAYVMAGAGGLIVPGKHVGYRGGQYFQTASRVFTVDGTITNPIIYRNYNGEHVEWINDNTAKSIENIKIAARYNRFWGIDAWRKHTDRYNYPGPGSNWYIQNASETGTYLIHCWGHEGSNGVFTDSDIGDVVIYGCGFFHAGVDQGPRAHGFYIHHTRDSFSSGTRLLLSHCFSFDHLGNCGQIFASGSPEQMDDIDILWLVAWGGGRIAGTTGQQNLTFGGTDSANIPLRGSTFKHIISRNPVGYGRAGIRFYDGGAGVNQDAVLEDCYLVGGKVGEGVGRLDIGQMGWTSFAARRNKFINLEQTQIISVADSSFGPYVWEDNQFYGSDPTATKWRSAGFTDQTWAAWKATTTLGTTGGHLDTAQTTLPTSSLVLTEPANAFEYGRGHVIVFNFGAQARVAVDLSGFLAVGDTFVVRNVQDYWGATINVYDAPSGGNVVTTWLGSPVYFPMDGVNPPPMYGYNNAALDTALNPAPKSGSTGAGGFDMFIVETH